MEIYVDTHSFDDRNISELGWTKDFFLRTDGQRF
jgi:hypothetical protein